MASGTRLIGRTDKAEVYCGSFYGATVRADLIAVDPPWRQGNLTYWSRRAGIEQQWDRFVSELIDVVRRSSPKAVYIKCGVPEKQQWQDELAKLGYVSKGWLTAYYAGVNAQIVAGRKLIECPEAIDSKQATTAIAQWALERGLTSAVDLCLGKGKMLKKFLDVGMQVGGIELAKSRALEAANRLGVKL